MRSCLVWLLAATAGVLILAVFGVLVVIYGLLMLLVLVI